jgi:hypothetical protein
VNRGVREPKPRPRSVALAAAEAGASRMAHTSTIEIRNLEGFFRPETEKFQMTLDPTTPWGSEVVAKRVLDELGSRR